MTYLPATINDLGRFAEIAQKSGLFKGSVEVAIVKLMAGAGWGIPPFTALKEIHIIQGSPCISATMQRALAVRAGYTYKVGTQTETECVISWSRGSTLLGQSTFTWEDAKKAGLTGKDNWRKYPKAMLLARASTAGIRTFCPDVFFGAVYDPEEMEPEFVESTVVENEAPLEIELPQPPSPTDVAIVCRAHAERLNPAALEAYTAQIKDLHGRDDLDGLLELEQTLQRMPDWVAEHQQPPSQDSLGGGETRPQAQAQNPPFGGQHGAPTGRGTGLKRPALRRPARSAK